MGLAWAGVTRARSQEDSMGFVTRKERRQTTDDRRQTLAAGGPEGAVCAAEIGDWDGVQMGGRLTADGRQIGPPGRQIDGRLTADRSEEHTSELQSQSISYAVFCLKKKKNKYHMPST